ncbi:Uncharacterised protein [Vibrio cholerae]|nr:Uncharacterised protein [Vibrio cholerae]
MHQSSHQHIDGIHNRIRLFGFIVGLGKLSQLFNRQRSV